MSSPLLYLHLLGGAAVTISGRSSERLRISSQKGLALLIYLAMNPGPHGRASLATLLWGDRGDRQARQSLRQCLATLRRDLGAAVDAMVSDDERIAINLARVGVDAREFEVAAQEPRLECLDLYSGPFLAGLDVGAEAFDEWAHAERSRLTAVAARAFLQLANRSEAEGDLAHAVLALERLVTTDPGEEEWHRCLLRAVAQHHGAEAALARAKWLASELRRHVDAEPSAETRALVDEIRRAASAGRERNGEAPAAAQLAASGARQTGAAAPDLPRSRSRNPFVRLFENRKMLGRGVGALALAAAGLVVTVAAPWRQAAPESFSGNSGRAASAPTAPSWESQSPTDPHSAPSRRSIIPIAVLPFKTYGDSTDSVRMLADMITDDLINTLSSVPSFRVISRQTTRAYQGRPIDVAAIGSELAVRYILEGTMRMQGDMLRVNVELIDPTTRLPVWSERIEREGADRYAVQDEIVARLGRELQFDLYPIESARRSNDPDADALAYLGWATMAAGYAQTRIATYDQALAYFKQALERDPQHVSAQIGIGAYHANVGAQVLDTESDAHRDKAAEILKAVIQRQPRAASAYHFLGMALNRPGTVQEALAAFERSIELNPSSAGSRAHIGNILARLGRPSEGLEHIRYAMRLSPHDPSLSYWLEFAGNAEMELNHYDEAIGYFTQSAALNPGYPRSWAGLVAAHALAGRQDEARTNAKKLKVLAGEDAPDHLLERFGRHKTSRLRQGLRLALQTSP